MRSIFIAIIIFVFAFAGVAKYGEFFCVCCRDFVCDGPNCVDVVATTITGGEAFISLAVCNRIVFFCVLFL